MEKTGVLGLCLLIVSATVMVAPAAEPEKNVSVLFQDALYQEQTAGDLDKAIELYEKVLTESGEVEKVAAKAAYQLGMCYAKKGDKVKAAGYFKIVVTKYSDQKSLVADASKQLEKIVPQSSKSSEELATIVKNAVETISTCTETDPKVKKATDSLAELTPSLVVVEVCKYLDSDTDTIRRAAVYVLWRGGLSDITPAQTKLIGLCSHKENLTRGMAILVLSGIKTPASFEAIKKMTEDSDGYARRCAVYALGLYGDTTAVPLLEKALQDSDPLVKANAQAAIKMLTQPKDSAIKATKPDKLRSEDLATEGWKLWQERKLTEAEKKFEESVTANPTNDNAWQGLGWAQQNQGKKQNAEASFKKCIELNPRNSAALNGLGWLSYNDGKKDDAVGYWEKAVKALPSATAALAGLCKVSMENEDYPKAVKYYKMWLKAEPDSQDAKNGLEQATQKLAEKK